MSEQNKALARRWFEEVWNQGSESTIDELFHPQGKAYGFPDLASSPHSSKAGRRQPRLKRIPPFPMGDGFSTIRPEIRTATPLPWATSHSATEEKSSRRRE